MILTYKGPPEFADSWGYQTEESAAFDLITTTALLIKAGETVLANTGLYIKQDYPTPFFRPYLKILSRSGMAYKQGVHVLNAPGTVDVDYPDEIKVILHNSSKVDWVYPAGARIAQAMADMTTTMENVPIKRVVRRGGFGSTNG